MPPTLLCAALAVATVVPSIALADSSTPSGGKPASEAGQSALSLRVSEAQAESPDLAPDIAYPFGPRETSRPRSDVGAVSARAALGLGVAGTAVAVGTTYLGASQGSAPLTLLGAAGVVLAPSAGQYFAGDKGAGTRGVAIRATGCGLLLAGAAVVAVGVATDSDCVVSGDTERCDSNLIPIGGAGILAGAGTVIGGTIYSVVDAPLAAKREERRRIAVQPTTVGQGSRQHPGIALIAAF